MPLQYLVGRTKYLFKWRIFHPDDIGFQNPIDTQLSLLELFGAEEMKVKNEFFLIF